MPGMDDQEDSNMQEDEEEPLKSENPSVKKEVPAEKENENENKVDNKEDPSKPKPAIDVSLIS